MKHKDNRTATTVAAGGAARATPPTALTLTVTGGKGGVGKTSVALNLALVLARQGYRTLLLDGDLELANVNVMLGLYPKATLDQAVTGSSTLREVLVAVRENLDLLPGASGVQNCLDQPLIVQRRFLSQLAELESTYDRVVIDTAAGLQTSGLHMVAAAHLTVLVITPDPTSLTDAFSLLKVLHRRGYKRQPSVVVNMARGSSQAQSIFQRFSAAVARYLGISCHYLGAIWRDESIAQAIVSQTPVATLPKSDPSARQFWTLADMLSVRWAQGTPRSLGFARYWIRLLERKRADTSLQAPHKGASKAQLPDSKDESEAGDLRDSSWPTHFQEWLHAPGVEQRDRRERLTEWLAFLGETLDKSTVDALKSGLSHMQWEQIAEAERQSLADYFRELADLIAPPSTIAERTESVGYAADVYGSQDNLVAQLRKQPSGLPLSQILEHLRRTENGLRRSGGRQNSDKQR